MAVITNKEIIKIILNRNSFLMLVVRVHRVIEILKPLQVASRLCVKKRVMF